LSERALQTPLDEPFIGPQNIPFQSEIISLPMLFLLSNHPLSRTQTQRFRMATKGRFSGEIRVWAYQKEMVGAEMIMMKYQ